MTSVSKYANYGINYKTTSLLCLVWCNICKVQNHLGNPTRIDQLVTDSVLKKISNKTCYAQHTTTKSRPSLYSISSEKEIDICRIECLQNRHIILYDVVNADGCQIKKPESQNRGKQEANFACAKSLYAEQQQKHHY